METYKKGEGKLTRRIAFVGLLFLVVWGFKELGRWLSGFDWANGILVGDAQDPFLLPYYEMPARLGVVIAIALTVVAGIMLWRFLNRPRSADLLIDTETEMKKVSWPSWADARQSTIIVLVFVTSTALFLLGVEFVLTRVFKIVLG